MNYISKPTPEGTTFRLIICGGRTFSDWEFLEKWTDIFLQEKVAAGITIEIVHGDCERFDESGNSLPTADQLAARYGLEHNYIVTPVKARWRQYGKAAGPLRNEAMREYGHAVLAFWNKNSKGTKNMITLARKKGLPVRVAYCHY